MNFYCNNQQANKMKCFFATLAALENAWDGLLLGVPKKRVSIQKRRRRMKARFPPHRQDIEVID